MALTPEDIESQTFKIARRGYDKVEVDRFLGYVAASYRDVLSKAGQEATPYRPTTLLTPAEPLPQRAPGASGAAPDATDPGAEGSPEVLLGQSAEAAPAEAAPATQAESGDDFNRLGSEVAAVLRTAHHSVATLRQEAEADAAVIRHRAEVEATSIRTEADEYANHVRAEADVYVTERKREADVERREAERVLSEARSKADADIADAEQRIATITERAEAVARARSAGVVADANRRVEQADATERALRERLIAAHGDLQAALDRLPASPGPKLVITDDAVSVVDLTNADEPSAEPEQRVMADGTDEPRNAEGTEAFAPMGEPGGWDEAADEPAQPEVATDEVAPADEPPATTDADGTGRDPLADMVKDAVGKAVQSAMNRRPSSDS